VDIKAEEQQREIIPPEMKLTPREREIVQEVENKIGKNVFQTNMRCLYFGEKRIYEAARKSLGEEFFSSFSRPDLNTIKKDSRTKTRIWHFFIKRRLLIRKHRIFRRYIMRETMLYPDPGGTYIMNTEELATIFHPPIEANKVGTMLTQVHSKKGEAPVNLPI
jgi:hypothetical protein